MGEDWGSWFPQHQFDVQSHNLKYFELTNCVGRQSMIHLPMTPIADMISTNGHLPISQFPWLPNFGGGQANEPDGWSYCLPCFRQAYAPAVNPVIKEKLLAAPFETHKEAILPKRDSGYAQKKFLVFDQSGDRTTLIFSSGVGSPVQCTTWNLKPSGGYNLNRGGPGTKESLNLHSGPMGTNEFGENDGTDLQGEMHEDTEELNALLYSDDESDYTEDDDEVTSTGHSPSTMTAQDKQDWFDGSIEEVASSDGLTKKRKLFHGGYSDVPSIMDTASSVKPTRGFVSEDDAESTCANCMNSMAAEMGSEPDNKRIRREKIHETVNMLQNIIPGGKGNDAIVVLDEAIHYLKSLRVKVKALGLDTP